jgi:hypothetical protein
MPPSARKPRTWWMYFMLTLEERLIRLEQGQSVPGTQLCRVYNESGILWGLGIGLFSRPKQFFYGKTIKEVIIAAEKQKNKLLKRKDKL